MMNTEIVAKFIGREKHLDEFRCFVRGEKEYRVLFIPGPGGIGKTWLLREMLNSASKLELPNLIIPGDIIDMYSTANHSVDGVQTRIAMLLEEALGRECFAESNQKRQVLNDSIQAGFSGETLDEMREQMYQTFLDDCRRLSDTATPVLFLDTFERVQRDPVGAWIMNDLVGNLPGFRFVIASREFWRGNGVIHSIPLAGFTPEEASEYFISRGLAPKHDIEDVLQAIRKKAAGHPLLIELAIEWLRGDLLREPQKLQDISEEEFKEAMIAPLREMGRGIFGNPELDEAIHQTILFMAHFNRRFSADLLHRLEKNGVLDLCGHAPQDFIYMLEQGFLFVKSRPDGYLQLHDEMEVLVQTYLWPAFDRTGEFRRELAQIACNWYDDLIAQSPDETTADDLRTEQLTYLLDVDLEEASQRLDEYVPRSHTLDYLLVTEISVDRIKKLRQSYRYQFAADLGARAARIYDYKRAQKYWTIARDIAEREGDHQKQVEALLGLQNCTYQDDLAHSLEILSEALNLCDRCESMRPKVLYEIGFTYRRMENIEEAITWYEKARSEALKQRSGILPTILNDMGYAHVFIGEYVRAEYLVKAALELRQEKLEGIEDGDGKPTRAGTREARLEMGYSWNTLGQILRFKGDLAAATGAYSRALSIFHHERDYLWQARALHCRGEAHRRLADLLYSQGRTEASADFDHRAEKDIQDCLDLCDQYGFDDEKHTALRRMGRLLHDRALRKDDPDESLSLLTQARRYTVEGVQVAQRAGNHLEELENLTELAFLVDDRAEALNRLGRLDAKARRESRDDIERFREGIESYSAVQLRIYQAPVFKHLLELEEGAYRYVIGDFGVALDFYVKGYKGLAMEPGYGVARFRQHLGHLFKRLRQLKDPEHEREWCERFIQEWGNTEVERKGSVLTLAELYPDFIERLNLYLDTAFIYRE